MPSNSNNHYKTQVLVVEVVDGNGFTKKEMDILRLICCGLTRKEMAVKKSRSFSTVSKHVERIAQKLDAHSSAEIVAKAIAAGIVSVSMRCIVYFPPVLEVGTNGLWAYAVGTLFRATRR